MSMSSESLDRCLAALMDTGELERLLQLEYATWPRDEKSTGPSPETQAKHSLNFITKRNYFDSY